MFFLSLFFLSQLGDVLGRYSVENLQYEAEAMQQWHHQVEEVYDYEGSSYSLGNTDFSTIGLITKAPIALITTFCRPFPWEVRNPLMALSSLESLALFSMATSHEEFIRFTSFEEKDEAYFNSA